jgi:hypothetical protein
MELEMTEIYTRQQYMADSYKEGMVAHRRYFGQFVTQRTIHRVVDAIGADRIKASTDEHMNDIPLYLWDRLVTMLPGSARFKEAGDYYTLANGVCLAKEAARQWLEQQQGEEKA